MLFICFAVLYHTTPCHAIAMPCHAMPSYAMPWYSIICFFMLCVACAVFRHMPCHAMPCKANHSKPVSLIQAIGNAAWGNIHGLSYHTYLNDLTVIQSQLTMLYAQYNKPIWVTEIASGNGASADANRQLMVSFTNWAKDKPWIERIFWNQAVSSAASIELAAAQSLGF